MTSFKTISATAASFTAGLCLLSVSGNAAQANPFNTFGIQGGCNSLAINDRGSARNCDEHRNWTSREAGRNRQHSTQSQLIGLGGGLIGQLINSNQQRQQQRTSRPSAELALIHQQQEIKLLKMKLQLQEQQQHPYPYQTVNHSYQPAVQPVYRQPRQQQPVYQQMSYQPTAYPQQRPTYQQPIYQQHQPRLRY